MARVSLNQRHSVFTRGPCLIKSAPQCSLCHASVSWSVLGAVVVLKARPSWVKLKSWLIPSSTTPRGYYFHPFPDDWAEGAKYRFSGFTPNKQTNKQTSLSADMGASLEQRHDGGGIALRSHHDQRRTAIFAAPAVCSTTAGGRQTYPSTG